MKNSDKPTCGDHGGTRTNGEPCARVAGWGTPEDSGKCKQHKGTSPDGSSHEGNQNATKHGLHSDPVDLLDDLYENNEEAYAWIQDKFESYLTVAPFDRETAYADQLMQVCVREYSIWKASGLQIDNGVVTEQTQEGEHGLYEVEQESPVNLPLDRMERTVVQRLEKLGVMPSPEQQRANAEMTLAEALADDS